MVISAFRTKAVGDMSERPTKTIGYVKIIMEVKIPFAEAANLENTFLTKIFWNLVLRKMII